jgi:hypothetical protein
MGWSSIGPRCGGSSNSGAGSAPIAHRPGSRSKASREAWQVHNTLVGWGHEPTILDTTRVRALGVGHHRRKSDALDAEVAARAVEANRIPEAHVLSPDRRVLRAQLSVHGALVETRAYYITTIRGLARAAGVLLRTCAPASFVGKIASGSRSYP